MSRTVLRIAAASSVALFLSGCATWSQVAVQPSASAAVKNHHSVYLITHGGRSSDMDANIEKALLGRGFTVTTGSESGQPSNAVLVVNYTDDWAWDFAMYLRAFDFVIYDGQSKTPLAEGVWQNSFLHGYYSADKVVDQVVGKTVRSLHRN